MPKRDPINLYGYWKAILVNGIILNNWWKKEYDFAHLVQKFGAGALQRGVKEALAAGETVPEDVLKLVGAKQ
jgi:hypothetical protein